MLSNRFKKLSTNNLIVLAALVSLLAAIALFLVGRTLLSKVILNGKVIGRKLAAQHQLDKNIEALPGLTSNYQSLGNLQGVIETAIPTKPDFPALVSLLESIAGASGVELDSVSPGNTTTSTVAPAAVTPGAAATATNKSSTDSPQPYPIIFIVKGRYPDVIKLLSNVQLSTRPLQITAVTSTGTNDSLVASVSATAYYFSPSVLENKTEVVK